MLQLQPHGGCRPSDPPPETRKGRMRKPQVCVAST